MLKRYIIVLAIFFVFIGGIGYYKYASIRKMMAQGGFTPPPTTVTSVVTTEENWAPVLSAVGSFVPVEGVNLSADLDGIVSKIGFVSGRNVQAGELLVQLDTTQEEAALRSAKARSDLAAINRARFKDLLAKNATSKSEYDTVEAECRQAEAAVDEQNALIARKTIRAPFAGLVGIRKVNVGQYVKPGDSLVEIASLSPIYVNFSLPQQYVPVLHRGLQVRVALEGLRDRTFTGEITALNSAVDEATRNIQAQATIRDTGDQLRPGMFCKVEVDLPQAGKIVAIPSSSISYAPYGNTVFIIEDGKSPDGKKQRVVRQQVVELGPTRGDQVAITKGIRAGEEIVTSGVFKLRAGAEVIVNNEVTPDNNPAPNPADS